MTSRILVVDDSLTVRMDLGEALEAAGFDVVPCADLRIARDALHAPCALIILDIVLPDGDGVDFLRELKGAPATATIPVMMLSTEAEVGNRVRGIGAGADDYIGKPYDLGQLVIRVRALLRTNGGTASTRRRVLVIDDSATFRNQIAEVLEAAGYAVQQAATGEDGLAAVAASKPDAVLVDGVLPGIDGATVIRRLKSDTALRDTPCILLTATEGTADELRSLEAGADAYVRKSEDLGVILVKLAALLRSSSAPNNDASSSLLGPKRLLAIDDSVTYLQELGAQLRQEGYDVVLAKSGEEGLELLAVQQVDCILLDLIMPGLSGQDTCRRIKESPAWRDIPLVMLTARDDRDAMIEGINAGADDYIAKSSDFDVLKARLRAQLRRKHFEDENRRIREKLVRRENEARFQRLIQSNIIGVILADLGGQLTEANDAFLAMLGYSRDDLEAGRLHWDELTPSEWRPRDEAALVQLRATGSATPYEKEYIRKDGSHLPIVFGVVLLEGSHTVVGFVLDRTEQKAAATKLQQYAIALETSNRELVDAKDRAERESRFKSTFLANMSHELRTPLNAIIGFSELLEQELFGALNVKQADCVQNVLVSGRHLLSLVNDILDLAKIESGKMELAREWTPLALVVDAVLGVVKTLANQQGVVVSIVLPPTLPDLYIDPVRIKQVLYNLLSNAIKFTPRGGAVELSAQLTGKYLEVACKDTGVGIRAEDLPRLFREFEQIAPVAGGKPEGTGLGLALTKRIVELHGGTISAHSEPNKGSTFTFTLPMLRRDTTTGPLEPIPIDEVPAESVVLVIEDDLQAADLIGGHLRAVGLSVTVASNADDALRLAIQLQPVAITLDILMPGLDGWAILAQLKSDPATRSIPVIVVSVVDETSRGLILGADDYLVKPISREGLLQSFEALGVPIRRVAGLRVLVAGDDSGDLDEVAALLRHAGCEVHRHPALDASALTGNSPIDVALVNLPGDLADAMESIEAFSRVASGLPVPVLAIVDRNEPPSQDLARLPLGDALTPERLVRVVWQAVDAKQDAGSLWHPETGLPSASRLRAHLRGLVKRAERELRRVALVIVKTQLPHTPVEQPWPRKLRSQLRTGEFIGVAAEDVLGFACTDPNTDYIGRFTYLVETLLGVSVLEARQVMYPDDGTTAEELIERAVMARVV